MDPAAWRKKEKLSLRDLAVRLKRTRMTVSRYESGEREAPTSVGLAYERISKGEVTSEDLNRVRKRFLNAEEEETTAAA